MADLSEQFQQLQTVDPDDESYVPATVSAILEGARSAGATDIHLVPAQSRLSMQWRIDGVLHDVATFEREGSNRIISRLKVLAGLLTYRTDVPQEGRISQQHETRVSTFPTLFGEKAVVRLFAESGRFGALEQLALPGRITTAIRGMLDQTSGVVLFCGPAGSGKTTTIYACLREIVRTTMGRRSVSTIEDPIEVVVDGTAQSQVDPSAGFDLASALRALMRQDPEVIMVGEIRDRETAEAVFQAALTGHLVLTTFHAGSAAGALSRLLDMDVEPYILRSTITAIVSQRLLRRLCECSRGTGEIVGCPHCAQTGFNGRFPIGEMLQPDSPTIRTAVLQRRPTVELEAAAQRDGMTTLREQATTATESNITHRSEVCRVLGVLNESPGHD